jgi:predicted AlkP superfamily phosphohydrolase/phosphomutase
MGRKRVLAIGLDGHEQSLGEKLMAEGELPHLAALRDRSARFLLDHGPATRTGLAWEHASSGRSPERADRWSAVDFDTQTYQVWHEGALLLPFASTLRARTVVFDPPYFDLRLAPSVRGVVNWGAHDPGVPSGSRPTELISEIHSRFGPYPAQDCLYDIVWASAERTRAMGDALIRASEVRAQAARWLLQERCPDWDLAFVVAGELHSACEAFWHGIDPTHPLHELPSAIHAADRLRAVYRATDFLTGYLVAAFPDAVVVAFAMNGMGPNRSDVASMVLLSELLYRHAFGRRLLRVPKKWANAPNSLPMLDRELPWSQAVKINIVQYAEPLDTARRVAARLLPEKIKRVLRPAGPAPAETTDGVLRLPLDWMPTDLYQPYWHAMPFFALPSFYDGRIRINLAGRERRGMVSPEDYASVCDEIESVVRACRDLRTGEPVVEEVVRAVDRDPLTLGASESDLVIVWRAASLGFTHPVHGDIGPLPYRRTGGHTGPYGMAYFAGADIVRGDYGVRSSFDVVPTIVELLGEEFAPGLSGQSLLNLARIHSFGTADKPYSSRDA